MAFPKGHSNPADRRRFGRRETFKVAEVIFDDGRRCATVVLDISEGGALLRFTGALPVEEQFSLLVPEDDLIVYCRAAHRSSNKMGVEFIRSPRKASRINSSGSQRGRMLAMHILTKDQSS